MTAAELILLVAAFVGLYRLLRPVQRRLEVLLTRTLSRRPRGELPTIDVTDFTSHSAHKKDRYHT